MALNAPCVSRCWTGTYWSTSCGATQAKKISDEHEKYLQLLLEKVTTEKLCNKNSYDQVQNTKWAATTLQSIVY